MALFGTVLSAAVLVASCGPSAPRRTVAVGDDAITVASFNFPESVILAEIYAQALEAGGFDVDRELDLGARELVEPALERGLVEFVPEYSGSALTFVTKGEVAATADEATTHRDLTTALHERGLVALAQARAQDKNGVVATAETATRFELRTISDLAPVASQLVFGGPPECPERPLCLLGLESTYGLKFRDFVSLDSGGPFTVQALAQGQVDVGLLFTTDGAIDSNGFVLLEDDRMLQPAENVTPVVHEVVVDRFGEDFVRLVNAVSAELTTDDLRELNALVTIEGERARDVATGWLAEHDLSGPVD
ncbi:MAG TPA: ABC transporter substrate-binding protein [Actinomycetota bacterium]|nr:ABC transporter substrate-binding protein [Actinomycetota bacterium]